MRATSTAVSASATGASNKNTKHVRRVVVGLACVWLLALTIVFAARLGFPLDLEWMEGGSLQQAMRIQYGLPIYERPSLDFVPFLYTPFYSVILAALGAVFPLDYTLGRLVSVGAWLLTCFGIWRIVLAEGKPRAHAMAAVGLFCAGYVFGFRWYDVARPDMTMLALVVWGQYFLRHSQQHARKAVAAGLLMGLAFWTKQTAAVLIFISGVGGLMVARRHLWRYVLTIFVVDAVGVYIGMWMTTNWLWTYIYELHQAHAFNRERFTSKTWGMFAHAAPFLCVWASALLGQRTYERLTQWKSTGSSFVSAQWQWLVERCRDGSAFWSLLAAAALLVSALGYSTQWAEPNAFIPGVCFAAIWLGVTLPTGVKLERVGLGLIASQLVFALFIEPFYHPIQQHGLRRGVLDSYRVMDPMRTLPGREAWRRASETRAQLQAQPGEVFSLHRPWWSILAGGPGHIGSMGLHDIPVRDRSRVRLELRTALRAGRYTTLWFDRTPPPWLLTVMSERFRLQTRLTGDARILPLSGYMSPAGMVTPYRDPQLVFEWIPEHDPPLPADVTVVEDFEGRELRLFFPEIKGTAFTRAAVSGLHKVGTKRGGVREPIGPHGGKFLVSSAASNAGIQARGALTSKPFVIPTNASLSLRLGHAGVLDDNLRVELVPETGSPTAIAFDTHVPQWSMARVSVPISPDLFETQVTLRIVDESPRAAVFVDDIWIHSGAANG